MYDYMAFLLVGIVVLGVGMFLGTHLTNHDSHDEHAHKALDTSPDTHSLTHHHDSKDAEVKPNTVASSAEIDALKEEFSSYRARVKQHLADTEQAIDTLTDGYQNTIVRVLDSKYSTPTSDLVHDLTQSYQNVFTQLSESAKALVDEPQILQRLDARRDQAVLINTQQRINKS